MKHTVRSFSIGLLASSLIILIVYYFLDNPLANQEVYNTEEMIDLLEEDGYRIVTEEEYISISVANAQNKNEVTNAENSSEEEITSQDDEQGDSDKENKEQESEEEVKDETVTKTITIESGMVTSQISTLLAEENLIDDAGEFNSYLLEHDYSLRVQMGDHELNSDMSFYEIAEAITR